MSRPLRRSWPVLAAVVALAVTGPAAAQQPVLAGLDFLETNKLGTYENLSSLSVLCPGCQVIGDPNIALRGIPLEESAHCPSANLGNVDTVVRRLADTPPLLPTQPATVPIQIVELHLQSVRPFQVDCQGQIQQWMLDVTVDPIAPQPTGSMVIRRDHPNGGTFDSNLPVRPLLTFTRVDVCPYQVVCQATGPIIQFQANNVPWVHVAPFPVLQVSGCTSNFVAGVAGAPAPASGDGGFNENALLRQHGVLPPAPPKLEQHSWQDAVHFTFWLTNDGGKDGNGTVDALRIYNPRWVPMNPIGSLPDSSVYLKSNSICNLDPLWTTPTSWCRVNWDSTDVFYRDEAWWFFPLVPPGGMAPEMDLVFSTPDVACALPVNGAWYEVDYECYSNCVAVEQGTFRFHCDPLTPTDAEAPPARLRVGGILEQNFPNPFNPTTTIRYHLNAPSDVRLAIYNAKGEVVRTFTGGRQQAGRHELVWDGRDDQGQPVVSGAYFYEIQAGATREARKMIIVK